MKLYTEEQVKQLLFDLGDVLFNNCQEGIEEGEPKKYYQELLNLVVPIELPSDEEAGVIALKIADTLKDKLTTEQEAYFIAGFQTYPKWMKEQILNQNK